MEKISTNDIPDKYKPKPKIELSNCQLSIAEVNSIFEDLLPDLASQQFKGWYCKMIYKLGGATIYDLAHQARKAKVKEPAKLFSALAKAEIVGREARASREAALTSGQ
jgi:hypothetical protein